MNDHSEHPHEDQPSEHDKSSKQSQEHKERQQYFLPGKIIVQVDHPPDKDPRELARLLNTYLGYPQTPEGGSDIPTGGQQQVSGSEPSISTVRQQQAPDLGLAGDVQQQGPSLNLVNDVQPVQSQSILTFPPISPKQDQELIFSIVPVELKNTGQQKVIDILLKINNAHKAKRIELEPKSKVFWRSESPNWLLGSAGHGGAHPPSPGSWPLVRTASKESDWEFSLLEKTSDKKYEKRTWPPEFANKGANVHIAILDTAPCVADLDEAYETWCDGNGQGNAKNHLIDRLLKPEDRKLRLVTDFYAEIELLDCSLARHRYWMADHGLFIASEIYSIAPESKIHLYKVFTSHGSASTLTLAQGLLRVLTDLRDGNIQLPLIVNCSFGLAASKDDPDFSVQIPNDIFDHAQTSLQELFKLITDQDQVIVVAAAGDDTDPDPETNPNKERAPARLPAAYQKVIAVGALPKDLPLDADGKNKAASYSNLANTTAPPKTGYMTLGGEHGSKNGILGIFTGEIPNFSEGNGDGKPPKDHKEATRDHINYKYNQRGSAEWAGASFAAPIITGILARWCSEQTSKGVPIKLDDARTALNNLSQGLTTNAGEHVILVKQG